VRHHAGGFRGILRRNRRAQSATTAGHPARDGNRKKIRAGNSAAATCMSPAEGNELDARAADGTGSGLRQNFNSVDLGIFHVGRERDI